jgi:hypothetical protein
MSRNILYLLLLAPLASAQAPSASQIAERLTANNLKADVSFLASDALQGRGTPSPGLDIAAEFIASQFRAAGLDPAGDDGYFQTAPFVQVTPDQEGRTLTLEIGGKTIAVDPAKFAVSDTVAAVELKQAGVFAASTLDGLTPEQVRGKVLILLVATGGRRRVNPAVLAALQPALVINVAAGAGLPAGPSRVRPADAPSVPTLMVWDSAMAEALTPGSIDAKITAHIAAPKVDAVKLRNVVGVLRGSDPALRDTYILVTGHYDHLGARGTGPGDHIFNGANDDASGTSCVIEIARTLSAAGAHPKRSIVFMALFGEEMGLLGSRYYAAHPIFPLAKTIADLNLEQMGRTDDNTGPRVGVVNATGFDFTDITTMLAKAGDDFGIKLVKDEQNSDSFFARSDNQALADAGIPSHTFSVGYVFPDYHQAGDEWPKIDYENMAKVDRTIALGLWRIADSTDVPHWNAANPKTEPYRKAAEALGK